MSAHQPVKSRTNEILNKAAGKARRTLQRVGGGDAAQPALTDPAQLEPLIDEFSREGITAR